jgi:hypothetical protein
MTFSIPRDYDKLPEFKRLSSIAGELEAVMLYFALWQELAYHADINSVGNIHKTEFSKFFDGLNKRVGLKLEFHADKLLDVLISTGCLKDDGDNLVSIEFIRYNRELILGYKGSYLGRNDASGVCRRKKKHEATAIEDCAKLPEHYLQMADGTRMPNALAHRSMVFIRVMDSIFSRPERLAHEFSPQLFKGVADLVGRMENQDVELLFRRVTAMKSSPHISRSTDQFMQRLDSNLLMLQPEVGWGSWAKLVGIQGEIPEEAQL